jgi:hypothetical protein
MSINTSELTQQVQENRQWVEPLVNEVSRVVVGKKSSSIASSSAFFRMVTSCSKVCPDWRRR